MKFLKDLIALVRQKYISSLIIIVGFILIILGI